MSRYEDHVFVTVMQIRTDYRPDYEGAQRRLDEMLDEDCLKVVNEVLQLDDDTYDGETARERLQEALDYVKDCDRSYSGPLCDMLVIYSFDRGDGDLPEFDNANLFVESGMSAAAGFSV